MQVETKARDVSVTHIGQVRKKVVISGEGTPEFIRDNCTGCSARRFYDATGMTDVPQKCVCWRGDGTGKCDN
ncbi:MAG: hypothetical protein WC596_00270 [Candidatus Shapirobacteria bacterium]